MNEEIEKCIRQPALIVVMSVKFHSNQKKVDQSIVENVSRSIEITSIR